MTHAPNNCPSPETLAAFAEGRASEAERAAVVAHLDECQLCMDDVALGMLAVEEEGTNVVRPRRWMPWLGAVAAAVAIVLSVPAVLQLRRSPIDRLVDAAPRTARVVEPRLTGGFGWAPYHGSDRSTVNHSSDPAHMKLTGAAGEVVERAQNDPSAEAQHHAGVAMLLTRNAEEATARLERAAAKAPSARAWNDLAAARYAAASGLGRPALYVQALAAADHALQLDEDLPEALFNRALILERLGLADAAREAWSRYLAVDPSSKWAEEARTHLAELRPSKQSSKFERVRPLLEEAAARGDAKALGGFLAEHAARARAFAEAEYLGRWGEAVLQKKEEEANRWLTISREIGAAMAADQNELLLRDAVRAVDDLAPPARDRIAAAHVAYRSGRIAYSRQQLGDALKELGRAAKLFTETRSPMALAARYYMAGVGQARHEPNAAAELGRVLADVDARPHYRALGAHVRWELGRAHLFDYDWTRAIAVLSQSARSFGQSRDRTSEAFVEAILAYALAAEGRGDESWHWRIQALRALSAEGDPALLAAALGGAMRAELVAGRRDAALALARIPQPVAGDAEQLVLVLDALRFQSMLEAESGSSSDALRTAQRAAALARTIDDASVRARRLADSDVAIGAATAASDPSGAIAPLTRAIDFYRRAGLPFMLPEPLLLRARCATRTGDGTAAARDIEDGMLIVERHRTRTAAAGTGILDADRALFGEAIRLALHHGDEAAAFAAAERARGAEVTLGELQQRLAGSETAVLEIALLPGELVVFAIAENDMQTARRPADAARLTALAEASLTEQGTAASSALYDELVRPVEALLARVQHVIVVPDPRLENVPFAALFDARSGAHLVERVSVAIAATSRSLQRDGGRAGTSLVTMSLPAGETAGTAALPQAREELAEIGALYPRTMGIAAGEATLSALRKALADADVVHVAGHTERQPTGGEFALLLAGPDGVGLQRASANTIAARPLPRAPLLVLAACETLRPPASAETRALSLGGAFAAAGVARVIGTLAPVGDRDARTFVRDLHRHLVAGRGAGEALRAAQLDAISRQKSDSGSYAWRSFALLTSRIDEKKGKVTS
ncbi:MAG TPA: CHAT domain-containing protein [Thermoanaerobaculia bacterium]|jgi:CHAT domain-containing protein